MFAKNILGRKFENFKFKIEQTIFKDRCWEFHDKIC